MISNGSDITGVIHAPFPADEEKPFVFISYAHIERNVVFPIIKQLYEKGWRVWYDEGLEIGDNYYQTLKKHVKDCSLFLLFASEKSAQSSYINDYEIPQALEFKKTIVICHLDQNGNFNKLYKKSVHTTAEDLLRCLESIPSLEKGPCRRAKGHTVTVSLSGFSRDLEYDFCMRDNGVELVNYKGSKKEVHVPAVYPPYSGLPVVALERAFCWNPNIETLYLPSSVSTIYKRCFAGCKSLKNIYIPSSVINIAFGNTYPLLDEKTNIYPLEPNKTIHVYCPKNSAAYIYSKRIRDTNNGQLEVLSYDESNFANAGSLNSYAYCSFDQAEFSSVARLIRHLERKYACTLKGSGSWLFYKPSLDRNDDLYCMDALFLYKCTHISEQERMDAISNCNCFISFVDEKYLNSKYMGELLEAIHLKKDIAIYVLDDCVIPEELSAITDMHQLRYNSGTEKDRETKLVNWLTKRGCRKCGKIPDFAFDSVKEGIKVLSYLGEENDVIIEESYGGFPVVEISQKAFWGCRSLSSIRIPRHIRTIGRNAFEHCDNLCTIIVDDENAFYSSNEGVLMNKDRSSLVYFPEGKLYEYTIPNSITEIKAGAFWHSSLKVIVISDHVKAIEKDAFFDCGDLTIICPESSFAYEYCKENNIPHSVML